MATKLQDFKCNNCSHTFEFLTHDGAKHFNHEDDDEVRCPKCSSEDCFVVNSSPLVTKLHDPDVLRETLKQRSANHTTQGLKKMAGHRGTLPPNFGKRGGPTIDS